MECGLLKVSGPRLAVMIRCLWVMKAFTHRGDVQSRRGQADRERGEGGGGLLHISSNITPSGNKQGQRYKAF